MSKPARSAVLAATLLCCGSASATYQSFTVRDSFTSTLAGLAATPSVIDFDGTPAGTTIPSGGSIDGLTFTYAFSGGVSLSVETGFDTTSPANFLGTDDGDDTLRDGDNLAFSFAPSRAFGLSIISASELFDGDFVLTVETESLSLQASAVQQTFPDGGSEWFLGIFDDAGSFTLATLTADSNTGGTAFFYNLDDLRLASPVPAPMTAVLVSGGLAFLALRRRRRDA